MASNMPVKIKVREWEKSNGGSVVGAEVSAVGLVIIELQVIQLFHANNILL